jgi:hypothetical protein
MNDFKTTASSGIAIKEQAHRLALVYQAILSWKIPDEEPSISNQEEQSPKKTEFAVSPANSVEQKANPQEEGEFTYETV